MTRQRLRLNRNPVERVRARRDRRCWITTPLRQLFVLATILSSVFGSSAYAAGPVSGIAASVRPARWVIIRTSTPDPIGTLKSALATPNMTVYLAPGVDLNLSNESSIPIAQGVQMIGGQPCSVPIGGRGAGNAPPTTGGSGVPGQWTPICGGRTPSYPGPRLYTTTHGSPLFSLSCAKGYPGGDGGVRLTGFRLQGPDWAEDVDGNDRLEIGVLIDSCTGVEISNMELSGWAGAAVRILNMEREQTGPEAVRLHDNFIHHNQHLHGWGYGVDVSYGGWAFIEHNVFDFNRHAITHGMIGSGFQHQGGYTAIENLVLKGGGLNDTCDGPICVRPHTVQQFDVHGDGNCPSFISSLWNCGQSGKQYQVLRNAFQFTAARAFDLRGTPLVGAFINNNVFAHRSVSDAVGTEPWGIGGLYVGANTSNVDTFGKYGVCDFNRDGQDDLFLATGTTWWYMSRAKQHWVYLNSMPEMRDQLAFGDFEGTGHCDVFTVRGNQWLISRDGSSPWQSLGRFAVPFDQLRFGHFTGSKRMEIFRRAPDGSWWLISPGVFGWRRLAGSSLPLSQLHFGTFNGHGITDVVANVNGHWSVSWGGQTAWQPLNLRMSDSLDNVLIADLNGTGKDDIVRYVFQPISSVEWQVSVGGRTPWQPLAQTSIQYAAGGAFLGHFDDSKGAQILEIGPPCDGCQPGLADSFRRSMIFSRATGRFSAYGKYSY